MEKWKAKYAGLGQCIIGNNDDVHLVQGMLVLIYEILKCLAAWTGDDMAWLGTQPFAHLLAPVLNDQGTQSYNKCRPSWMCCQGCKHHDCI
jgi:alpha-amylase/alpha-mannosidase (GH57 family)